VTRSRWFDSWNVVGGKHLSMVLGLATGGMPVSFGRFDYRCDCCEFVALGHGWVT
jgi:hypothetical protein